MNTGITVKLEKEGMTDYENNEFKILSPVWVLRYSQTQRQNS